MAKPENGPQGAPEGEAQQDPRRDALERKQAKHLKLVRRLIRVNTSEWEALEGSSNNHAVNGYTTLIDRDKHKTRFDIRKETEEEAEHVKDDPAIIITRHVGGDGKPLRKPIDYRLAYGTPAYSDANSLLAEMPRRLEILKREREKQ